jgi:hypothetical protein
MLVKPSRARRQKRHTRAPAPSDGGSDRVQVNSVRNRYRRGLASSGSANAEEELHSDFVPLVISKLTATGTPRSLVLKSVLPVLCCAGLRERWRRKRVLVLQMSTRSRKHGNCRHRKGRIWLLRKTRWRQPGWNLPRMVTRKECA